MEDEAVFFGNRDPFKTDINLFRCLQGVGLSQRGTERGAFPQEASFLALRHCTTMGTRAHRAEGHGARAVAWDESEIFCFVTPFVVRSGAPRS